MRSSRHGKSTRHHTRLLCGVLVCAAAAAATPVAAQISDVMPPVLEDFTFSPMAIDVSTGSQMVTVTLHITDDLSGTTNVFVVFQHPGTGQFQSANAFRTAGTTLDGTYTAVITFPQFAADGTWTASGVSINDAAGNSTSVSTAVLQSRGFPTDLMVTSVPDIQAPLIADIGIAPAVVDVSAGPQTVTFSLDLMDDLSGVAFAACSGAPFFNFFAVTVRSPSGIQNQFAAASSFALVSGTSLFGTWDGSLEIPQYSEAGTWQIQFLEFRDCAGNRNFLNTAQLAGLGLTTTFDVVSSPDDVQPPDLTDLSYVPIAINTSTGSQAVTVRFTVVDDLAGVAFTPTAPNLSFFEGGVRFRSPSGNQVRAAAFFSTFTLISGTPLNGVWETTIGFPQFSEDGTWNIDFLAIKDGARNFRTYNTAALQALGFPTELEVIRPSLDSDGTLGTGGGTVEDDTFGPRASLTLPPGAVAGPTDVAIDVFPNPLAIPTPVGFQGPGTLFVNIELTPTPAFPLAPPGMQIVLPLPNPLPAGTALSLYKVDAATGMLVPAIDVFGMPVVGFADANGLSATFFGVASLSTVVGLLPDVTPVQIDIKPGSAENPINLGSQGLLPVAILGTTAFDATTVDVATVRLAGASVAARNNGRLRASVEDVNGDGLPDLVLHFETQDLQLLSQDTMATLTGETTAGTMIMGQDAIRIVM